MYICSVITHRFVVNVEIHVELAINDFHKKMKPRKRPIGEFSHERHLRPFLLLESIPSPAKKIRHARLWIFDGEFHDYFSNGLKSVFRKFCIGKKSGSGKSSQENHFHISHLCGSKTFTSPES